MLQNYKNSNLRRPENVPHLHTSGSVDVSSSWSIGFFLCPQPMVQLCCSLSVQSLLIISVVLVLKRRAGFLNRGTVDIFWIILCCRDALWGWAGCLAASLPSTCRMPVAPAPFPPYPVTNKNVSRCHQMSLTSVAKLRVFPTSRTSDLEENSIPFPFSFLYYLWICASLRSENRYRRFCSVLYVFLKRPAIFRITGTVGKIRLGQTP